MLTDRERIVVELTVTETDLLDLEPGQVGVASFDAIDGIEYPVRITSVSRVPSASQGVVTYPVEALILTGDEIAEVAADLAVLGGQGAGFGAGGGAAGGGGGAGDGGAGGRGGFGGDSGGGLFGGIELPEGVTIQQVLQALASDEPLPEGVTLPEGFELPEQLLQRFAGGGTPGTGAGEQRGALAARPLPAPGMSASVTILTEVREEAVLVPTAAVRQLDGEFFVTVPTAEGGTARVAVEVGSSDATNVEILSGLEAGDMLLIGADSEGIAFSATQQAQQQLLGGFPDGNFQFGGGGGGRWFRRRRRRRRRGRRRRRAMIQLEDVTKVYATGGTAVHALAGVSLEIERGEFVAIIGQSGSGKTTMLNIIGLLDRPSSGAYRLADRYVSQLPEDARARLRGSAFGFVFQSYNLLPRMSALEQVELPLIYQGVKDRGRRAAEALVRVGLKDRIRHQPTELSGGEQQRVAIARSLVAEPLVVLADEPTGALDTATGREVMTLLTELVEERGLTVVLVTHEQEVAVYARRTIRMRDGRIVEDSGATPPFRGSPASELSHSGEQPPEPPVELPQGVAP